MADDPNDESLSVEHRAALLLVEDLKTLPKLVAGISGTPAGVTKLSPANELWAWNYQDETIDVHGLRAQGVPDVEIAAKRFPLRRHLIEQGGVTLAEQQQAARRLAERALRAQQAGRSGTPPERRTP